MPDLSTAITDVLAAHRPSRWRSFTNENEVLRCCGQDFGNATRKAKRDDNAKAWTAFAAHQAEMLAPVIREREAAALREAVSDFESSVGVGEFDQQTERDGNRWSSIEKAWECQGPYMDWLRNRADQLEES